MAHYNIIVILLMLAWKERIDWGINHDNIKYLLEQRLSLEEKQKWVAKMLGYDFEIVYKKGKQDMVEDALSRKIWGCWGITLFSFNYITGLDTWSKGRMEEWPISVDTHSIVAKGS